MLLEADLEQDARGPSIKAVKHDDAKVDSGQWDEWPVNNFESGAPAMVCIPNTYCFIKHGRLFDGLRNLAVRWYWRKVLRSFLSYLRVYHGNGTSTSTSVSLAGKVRTFNV